ncbi:GntR family transcriptional regulator [Aeromicrobium sp. CTD01-1L150]|uniref:GntR family transcriptional regulator n=1 Tax=Aeromicrobium sp. CTD01-1L150 TaxID=3341830 RepID=UPI0035BFA51D
MNRSKASSIAQHVRELIVTGQVRSGDFLRLDPLAHELGSSVTPVREALNQLVAEGFVELRPRRGFEVLPLTDADLKDVFLAQAMLAGELAARATRTLSPRDLDDLESLQDALEAAAEGGQLSEVERLNHDFHRRINRSVDAPRLGGLLSITTHFAPRDFFPSVEGWADASATEHRGIIDALRAQDADAARRAMEDHVHDAGALLIAHREDTGGRAGQRKEPDGE